MSQTRPKPWKWPNDAKIAIAITVAWEGWSPGVAEARGDVPAIEPRWLEKGVPDLPRESFQAFGTKRGIWRLMDLLERNQVVTIGVFSGIEVERHPEIAREWMGQGHEIAGHSYAQEISTYTLSREEERENIRKSVRAIEQATGERPVGWCSRWAAAQRQLD